MEINEEVIFIIVLLLIIIFLLIKLTRPITEKEIHTYALKLRAKEINAYFQFSPSAPKEYLKRFKSDKPLVDPLGQLIKIKIPFQYGPACISYWLKYKKHQWFIAMFCVDKTDFVLLYGNKGNDKFTINNGFGETNLFDDKMRLKFNCILLFHNHPMSIKGIPDSSDKVISQLRSELATINDWNYIEFLCVRGNFIKFNESYNSKFKTIDYYKIEFKLLHKNDALNNLRFRWHKLNKV